MKKTYFVVAVIIVGLIGFWGGWMYGKAASAGVRTNSVQGFRRPNGGNFQSGGSFLNGQVISKDDKSLTLKLQDGGSKIVFFSPTTQIRKTIDGSVGDIAENANISVNGNANADGSVTAQVIQVRTDALPQQSR